MHNEYALEQEIVRALQDNTDKSFLERYTATTNISNSQSNLTLEKLRDSILEYKKESTQWFWDEILEEHKRDDNTICVGHEDVISLLEKEFGLIRDGRPQWLKISQYVDKTGLIFMRCMCLCHPDPYKPWSHQSESCNCLCSGKIL